MKRFPDTTSAYILMLQGNADWHYSRARQLMDCSDKDVVKTYQRIAAAFAKRARFIMGMDA